MSTVSASIIGAYFTLIEPKYVVTAVVLNLFGGFIIASIINPYKVNEEDDKLLVEETEERQQSFFEMLGEYILDGFKVAVIVGAMLIGYIAIIALLNGIVSNIFSTVSGGAISWDFQTLIGFVFAPFAFLVGVPWQDAVQAGSVMATKLLSNEFVAMQALGKLSDLSEHAKGVTSVFLVSFANFSSIGIISGAIKSLNDKRRYSCPLWFETIIRCNTSIIHFSCNRWILYLTNTSTSNLPFKNLTILSLFEGVFLMYIFIFIIFNFDIK